MSGEVTSPGVVTLDSSCRVKDAISACGDFTPLADKNGVNLAQKLTDGMQINVPAQTAQQNTAQTPAQNAKSAPSSSGNAEIVNINTATKEQLDTLPGVGPATADKIIEYRQTNGPFQSVEDIKNVRGIGDAKFPKCKVGYEYDEYTVRAIPFIIFKQFNILLQLRHLWRREIHSAP